MKLSKTKANSINRTTNRRKMGRVNMQVGTQIDRGRKDRQTHRKTYRNTGRITHKKRLVIFQ